MVALGRTQRKGQCDRPRQQKLPSSSVLECPDRAQQRCNPLRRREVCTPQRQPDRTVCPINATVPLRDRLRKDGRCLRQGEYQPGRSASSSFRQIEGGGGWRGHLDRAGAGACGVLPRGGNRAGGRARFRDARRSGVATGGHRKRSAGAPRVRRGISDRPQRPLAGTDAGDRRCGRRREVPKAAGRVRPHHLHAARAATR
jgi:hypothetical protein